jgi:hypothetical protein
LSIQANNVVRSEKIEDVFSIPADIANDNYDFVIVVAHGNEKGTSAITGVQADHSYAVLCQLFTSFRASNKLLLICKGANPSSISELCIGLPDVSVNEAKVLIAKMENVNQYEVIVLTPMFFKKLNDLLKSNQSPTRDEIQKATDATFSKPPWLIIDGNNVEEESD